MCAVSIPCFCCEFTWIFFSYPCHTHLLKFVLFHNETKGVAAQPVSGVINVLQPVLFATSRADTRICAHQAYGNFTVYIPETCDSGVSCLRNNYFLPFEINPHGIYIRVCTLSIYGKLYTRFRMIMTWNAYK